MPDFGEFLIDRNADGFYDDALVRFIVDPEVPDPTFWSRLFDFAALVGLECHALPLPLFLSERPAEAGSELRFEPIRTVEDIEHLLANSVELAGGAVEHDEAGKGGSSDLLDLFAISGMLTDLDGDLLPDATSVSFDVPDELGLSLGVALANLTTRIGLESGGVSLPLTGEAARMLRLRPESGPARIVPDEDGWLVQGDEAMCAELIEQISRSWPHFGMSDTAGARYGVEALARGLAGDLPLPPEPGAVLWELQWSAEPETARLLRTIERELLPRVATTQSVEVVAFACEPPAVRRGLARAIEGSLAACGVPRASVTVLSAFKVGLSWLQEVVVPALAGHEVARLRIDYRRFEPDGVAAGDGEPHLDLPIRWLQELFPGNEIAARALGLPLDAISMVETTDSDAPVYRAEAFDAAGRSLGEWECELLSYAMPFLPNAPGNGRVQVSTGGFIARLDGETLRVSVDTDLDRFWRFWQDEALRRVTRGIRDGGGFVADRQPFFGALEVEVWLSAPNGRLGVREENDSAAEALHEDIYFNALDTIEVLGVAETGDRTSAPGAVVPVVHARPGVTPHATVRLRAAPAPRPTPPEVVVSALEVVDGELVPTVEIAGGTLDLDPDEARERAVALAESGPSIPARLQLGDECVPVRIPLPTRLTSSTEDVERPPMSRNIHGAAVSEWAAKLAGSDLAAAWVEDYSYQGREIVGMALRSPAPGRVWSPAKLALLKPTALIVARHHANEISSTNAAFRLVWLCANDFDWADLPRTLNVVILPYENADGAALHARLAAVPGAETWKHHPARYNALGHEFSEAFHDARPRYGESRARPAVWRRWLPDVVVDNHGVPSHEWVQPFAGFGSPPRFRVSYWIPQALLYGIVRHVDDPEYPAHVAAATALREAVSIAIRDTDLGDLNREIGRSYRFWGQEREPERFPGEFHDDMLWHLASGPADPEGRGFNVRHPRTTVLSWVTEVNDETATGEHLERVARAHLLANRAMLDLMIAANAKPERTTVRTGERVIQRFMRRRPLRLG